MAAPAPVEGAPQEESMKRTLMGLIVVLALGLGLGLAREGAAAPRGTLTIGIPTDINTLDPQMGPEVNSLNVAFSTMEPLLRLDAQGNIKPLLAESWEVIDNVTYVFRLRKNVKFHNGEPFTGKAVEYSWKRSQEKHRANKTYFASVSRIEHLDDHTIRIVTERPDPVFLKKMGAVSAAIFAPKATADGGDEGTSLRPVGTGPFVLSSWVKGEHITFKANPNYYLPDVPKVETLVWRVIPEAAARVAALQTGPGRHRPPHPAQPGVRPGAGREPPGLLGPLDPDLLHRLQQPDHRQGHPGGRHPGPPGHEPRGGPPGHHPQRLQRPGPAGEQPDRERPVRLRPHPAPHGLRPAKAKQLLAEAGVPNGFKVGLACPSGAYANDKEACQAIAGSLGKLGIEVDLQIMESNRFWDLQAKKQLPPLFFDGVGDRLQDPGTQLRGVAHPVANWTAFEKKEFTELIDQAGSTVDQEQRKRLYAKLARDMQADPPFLFLWQVKNFEGVRKRVQGYTTRPTEDMGHVAFDVGVE